MTKVDFIMNHLSSFAYEPFLLPSQDFVSYTTFSSDNVVFHGLKQKSRTENTTDGGQMVSIIPTRSRGEGSTIMLC